MPAIKQTASVKVPPAKKAVTVSSGTATLGKPGAPKAKRALKAIVPEKLQKILDAAEPLPGRKSETDRLIGRITPAEGFNDFTVAIIVPGNEEGIRYFGVQIDVVKGKRLSKEKMANEVAKLAIHYENIRSQGKFCRGMPSVTAVVIRQPKEGVKLAVFSFNYRTVEATAF